MTMKEILEKVKDGELFDGYKSVEYSGVVYHSTGSLLNIKYDFHWNGWNEHGARVAIFDKVYWDGMLRLPGKDGFLLSFKR